MASNNFLRIVSQDIEEIVADDLPWEQFSGSVVVVTGASGFMGSYLVRILLSLYALNKVKNPVRVIGVVRNVGKSQQRFADILDLDNFTLCECNLSDPGDLDLKADWFIHAASQASPKYYNSDPVGTLAPNVIGTHHLLKLAKSSKAKGLIFFSSSEVYGDVGIKSRLSETDYGLVDPMMIRSSYAESKRMGENMCISWMHQHGVPIKIVRPFHTYGPGLDLADGRVFSDFIADVVAGRDIQMASDGQARRAFCYIADAMRGIFRVILLGEAGQAYNVANPQADLSILELANLMVKIFPEKNLRVQRKTSLDSAYMPSKYNNLLPDISKIKLLSWNPVVLPEDGFKRMATSYS